MNHHIDDKLATILSDHKKWSKGDGGGKCASLQCADLQGASLQCAYLHGASLQCANLQGADLQGASLQGAYLHGADLRGADLHGANLQGVKIKTCAVFTGIYKYVVMPVIAEDGSEYIRMGCFFLTTAAWAENFWNNSGEFPNHGDKGSKDRWNAYQCCLRWLDDHREAAPTDEGTVSEKP